MRLDTLTQIERAVVLANGHRAGFLVRTPEDVQFVYEADYQGPAVATTLPIRREPYNSARPGAVPPFFANLLPEGRRMTALRAAAKTSADDELTLLLAIGSDTIGHVQVRPEGTTPTLDEPPAVVTFGEVRFTELFARVLSRHPADRVGLPGVQDKVSGKMISLPLSYRDSAWILKFNPPESPHLVENEAFFLAAAKASGLTVPDHEVVRDADGAAGLLIRRFDRVGTQRLAQEDGCQVCGRYPADKYRMTSEALIVGLSAVCGAPIVAARTLIQQLAFAYLTCNGDAHAKNFSVFQQRDGEWRVTPAYDLPSSHPYGDTTMALSIAGKRSEDIGRADFISLGAAVGVRERAVARAIDALLDAAPAWLDQLDLLPFDRRRTHKLGRAIAYRMRRLAGGQS